MSTRVAYYGVHDFLNAELSAGCLFHGLEVELHFLCRRDTIALTSGSIFVIRQLLQNIHQNCRSSMPCWLRSIAVIQFSGFLWRTVASPPRRPCAPGPIAGIIAVAPVGQVVPALRARPGMVGDLRRPGCPAAAVIARVTSNRSAALSPSRADDPPRRRLGREARAGLDGELVEREMFGAEADSPRRVRPPIRRASGRAGRRSGRS